MTSANQRFLAVVGRVAIKEATLFFASPIAWLFLASFAAITLFVFFWVEAFFARNVADVRPLFQWMPLLLVFLCSTLSMRMWSEERRAGTLEHVLTQSAPVASFVLGKFIACLGLLAIAMAVTLPLPFTVATLGELDWGPVLAGYVATFLLGAAYLAIGLFVSSRTANQIVSLIVSVAICGAFWLIGAPAIVDTVGQTAADWLRAFGTGARFESIARGMLDTADLFYYLSLTAIFLSLNVLSLERERWSRHARSERHRRWYVVTVLLILNLGVANLWLGAVGGWRLDTTRGQQFTLSEATRAQLQSLREPLTLRGYFSARTHPLLAPLVPQMRDLLVEYALASDGQVRVEFVDPQTDPEAEEDANRQYGIEPVPFQVADRYQSSIVSSYFDVLVQYGDEYRVLGFQDLIEVKTGGETDIDVALRNPEYDLTRAIRRVVADFQSAGNLFALLGEPLRLTVYSSPPDRLPEDIAAHRRAVEAVAERAVAAADGALTFEIVDPDADGGDLARRLTTEFGLLPYSASLFDDRGFWFHPVIASDSQSVQVPVDELTEPAFQRAFDTALKRFVQGFTRRIAFVAPTADDVASPVGAPVRDAGPRFDGLRDYLATEHDVVDEDLADGRVSVDADLLLLVAPEALDERAVFAVDQFLMRGGTVIAASSPFSASLSRTRLDLARRESGLDRWFAHHGLVIEPTLALDPQNAAFPVPVTRRVGGLDLQDLQLLDYPYFVDVRRESLANDDPMVADLSQVTMAWASPIALVDASDEALATVPLIRTTADAWTTDSTDIMPRLGAGEPEVWPREPASGPLVLAASRTGRFDSWFAGRGSPLDETQAAPKDGMDEAGAAETSDETERGATSAQSVTASSVIERSPESARLILFASNDFLRDQVVQLTGATLGSGYLAPYELVANAIEHVLDDSGLSAIRSRGQFNRTLLPLSGGWRQGLESLNYALAIGIILVMAVLHRRVQRRRRERRLAALVT